MKTAILYPEGEGGREICHKTRAGHREYKSRIEQMWTRQHGLCALCERPLCLEQATFDHEYGRGFNGSKRDDRISVDGEPINAAVHFLCNVQKGSKRTEYLIKPRIPSDLPLEAMLEE